MNKIPIQDSIESMTSEVYKNYTKKLNQANEDTKKLNSIPHLKLDLPNFNYNVAYQEITKAIGDNFTPIECCDYTNIKGIRTKHDTWSSSALVNYIPYSDRYFSYYDREDSAVNFPNLQPEAYELFKSNKPIGYKHMRYYKTEIYKKMSYITSYLEKYVYNTSYRVLIWKLAAGGSIGWHHHSNKQGNTDINDNIIVHLPVMSHPDVKMMVRINNNLYEEYYAPGNAYIFNSVYDHAVINNSNVDRLHIIAMLPFKDEKIWKIIKKSFKNYD